MIQNPILKVLSISSIAKKCKGERTLLRYVLSGNMKMINRMLMKEEDREREKDIEYWTPLKKELEKLRHHKSLKIKT